MLSARWSANSDGAPRANPDRRPVRAGIRNRLRRQRFRRRTGLAPRCRTAGGVGLLPGEHGPAGRAGRSHRWNGERTGGVLGRTVRGVPGRPTRPMRSSRRCGCRSTGRPAPARSVWLGLESKLSTDVATNRRGHTQWSRRAKVCCVFVDDAAIGGARRARASSRTKSQRNPSRPRRCLCSAQPRRMSNGETKD